MFIVPGAETVPFHFVWISLAVVYGFRPWSLPRTAIVLGAVCLVTGAALERDVQAGIIGWEEMTEVPLMSLVFLASVWHVRRRVAAEQAARVGAESERRMRDALKRFVRFASHELRTPVTVARGYTELLRVEHPDAQLGDDAAVVLDELDKLERISSRLLDLAQVEEQEIRCMPTDIDALLRRTARRWRPAAERHWLLETDAGSVMADAERLEASLDCLLDNAVKYTSAGATIELRGRRDADWVTIEVIDEGTGIAPDELPYIFEAFHSGPRGGSGLGLAVVHATALAHQGTVSVADSPMLGCTFTLRLPVPTDNAGTGLPQRAVVEHDRAMTRP
ncbi:HAMP domain-containing histidine kinase [Jatrophihabitans telluris]|uniref:histidine kinase n=1 Tax=Jatrophihabitans telluris TaxID=2038343 RepID=A0ABY4QZ57_9ACTN|nr:HAMP domain-containing sensor histidine kinase [Jatrophihabitans telluris]UQX88808.1 HAMP domain-containing histidine kinase [Jatrophihabitans telluris]